MRGTIEIPEAEIKESPEVQRQEVPVSSLEHLMTAPVQVRPLFQIACCNMTGKRAGRLGLL